jgi:hypothetical protein
VLEVPVNYFFDDMPPKARPPAKRRGRAKDPVRDDLDLMGEWRTLDLVRAYYKIESADIRQRMREMITVLGHSKGS